MSPVKYKYTHMYAFCTDTDVSHSSCQNSDSSYLLGVDFGWVSYSSLFSSVLSELLQLMRPFYKTLFFKRQYAEITEQTKSPSLMELTF